MKRIPLPIGAVAGIDNKYTTDAIIGLGANCIVYDAHYLDSLGNKKPVKLKECYPIAANVTRNKNVLSWKDGSEKESAYARFEQSYQIASQMQNSDTTRSTAVYSLDLFEYNNTKYVAMIPENGISYDKDTSENIEDIIRTALALTNTVGRYHQIGYLHLDVKPSNFIATADHTGKGKNIALFDFDTLIPIDNITDKLIQSVSYSKGWAAPEQMQQQIGKLCPATDLFSIGAVLFERVMKRKFENSDMSPFAEWEYDNRFDVKSVNPKVKRLLTDIFHKTLTSNVKKRYQTANDLAAALRELLDVVTDGRPYIISAFPAATTLFLGREFELREIQHAFTAGNKVFLHGIGGIGKSALAIAYANRHQAAYDTVIFLRYNGSLEDMFIDINIENFDGDDAAKRKNLKRLLDERTLLVIDNFDVEIDDDDYFDEILSFKAHTIITSRTDFVSVFAGDVVQIEVGSLTYSSLALLFSRFSGISINDLDKQAEFKTLLKAVDYHTLTIELLGRQIAASGSSISMLTSQVEKGIHSFTNDVKVKVYKDGRIIKRTIPEILRVLFQIADLREDRKQVLRNIYLIRFMYIDKITYHTHTLCSTHEIDALNDLVELGWIQTNGIYYSLHPLIEGLVRDELKPNQENSQRVYYHIQSVINDCCDNELYDNADEYEFDNNCELLCAFFYAADFHIHDNLSMAICWLTRMIDSEDRLIGSPEDRVFGRLYKKLIDSIRLNIADTYQVFEIRFIFFVVWLYEFRIIYCDDSDSVQKREEKRLQEVREAYNTLKLSISSFSDADSESAKRKVCESLTKFLDNYTLLVFPSEILAELYEDRPEYFELNPYRKSIYGLPLTAEEQEEFDQLPKLFDENTEQDDETQTIEKCLRDYRVSDDKASFISTVASNHDLMPKRRAKIISECMGTIFGRIHIGVSAQEGFNWQTAQSMLDIEEDLLYDDWDPQNNEERKDRSYYLSMNSINQAITYATLGKLQQYERNMDYLLNELKQAMSQALNHRHWSQCICADSFDALYFKIALNGMRAIRKTSYILPYLIRYTNEWEEYARKQSDFGERYFFDLYREIAENAESSLSEEKIPEKYQMDYADIGLLYRNKIGNLTGLSFVIKPEEDD